MENEQTINQPEKNNKKTIVIVSVIVGIFIIALIGWFLLSNNDNKDNKKSNTNTNSNPKTGETSLDIKKWNNTKYTNCEKFYADKVFTEEFGEFIIEECINTAVLTNETLVIRVMSSNIMAVDYDFFMVDTNGKVTFLANYSSNTEEIVQTNVSISTNTVIPKMFPETDVAYNGQVLIFKYHGSSAPTEAKYVKKLASTEFGDLYEYNYTFDDNKDLYSREFFIKTPDNNAHFYEVKGANIFNDDSTLKVTWSDNKNKTTVFVRPTFSCGGDSSFVFIKTFDTAKATKVGTVNGTNQPVYKVYDEKTIKYFYDDYYIEPDPDYEDEDGYYESHGLSFADYKMKLTHITYQTALGDWVVLANEDYGSASECGKPVIYLYPTVETLVSVSVGADITISEPLYPIGGWTNVLAQPNGTLTYRGSTYDSLFWEGLGHGRYPNVNGIGKVVTQDKLIATIKQDLTDQGLNQKEIADFVDFWKDHLPKTPYVKLTWFTTEQMNALAPLNVNPKPNTVIRVFMDARGLQEPIELTPQKLTKVERKGFTLVEWGGLLQK